MKKLVLSIVFGMMVTFGASVATVSAFPAQVVRDTGCVVRDADGIQSIDDNCRVHIVRKFNNSGDLQFLTYQDKGRLPEGAALPSRGTNFETFFACGGCNFEGTYIETINPSGNYTSRGPY